MNDPSSFSLEEFDRLINEGVQEKSLERAKFYGREEVLWTALAPSWTIPLAEKSHFPVSNVESYLEDLREKSVVRSSEVRSEEGVKGETVTSVVYSMDEVTRSDVIETYAQEPGRLAELRPLLTRIGNRILEAIGHQISAPPAFAPPALVRWAVLAAHSSTPASLVDRFEQEVEQAFKDRASATIRDWMNAARPFSGFLLQRGDDSMKQALQRASQRLILLRREESDQRHLKHFYERPEQLAAFKELMGSDDNLWATHFLGAGGVGKTMLVRKITVEWAKEHGVIPARVDFDYLKADYPSLDPGMLLWAFAQDLRAYAGTDAIRLFNKADRQFHELSMRLQSEFHNAPDRRATDFPEFREAISLYAEAIKSLPSPVLLIVDTCEELAKINVGHTPTRNIDETFRILRALHDGEHTLSDENAEPRGGVPGLRVIFSGRRPLARQGVNWSCPSAKQLKPRKFLRLHEVRGFSKEDARRFLEDKMNTPAHLIPAIVERSAPDTGSVAHIDWDDPKNRQSRELRCNPYDLRLYAEWAKEEPPPTAEEIRNTPPATQYVELRVIRRLHDESLRQVLPVVALLGHFDRRALQEILKGTDIKDPDRVFNLLQEEEWINQRTDQDSTEGANLILDVEAGLRTRLFVYFRNDPLIAEVQPNAANYFEKITLEGDPNALDWSTFDAAITVLESDRNKSRVFDWWRQVEERMIKLRPAVWFSDVTDKLQNEGGAAAWRDPQAPKDTPPESRLRPAVLASNASARLRAAQPSELNATWRELTTIWDEVLKKSARVSSEIPELELIGRAGFIAASLRVDNAEADINSIQGLWQLVDDLDQRAISKNPQLRGVVVSAVEAVVEFVEANATKKPSLVEALLTTGPKRRGVVTTLLRTLRLTSRTYTSDVTESLRSFAYCLAGRAETLLGNYKDAREFFKTSLLLVDFSSKTSSSSGSVHNWVAPEDVASRVRLEFARAAYPAFMSAAEVVEVIGDVPVRLESIDNNRLHSALLRLRHAQGPVANSFLSKFEGLVAPNGLVVFRRGSSEPSQATTSNDEAPVCRAHHMTPPLYVTVGEVLAQQGRADEVLYDLAAVANSRTESYRALLDIDRVCSGIILRMRLRDVGLKGGQTLKTSADIDDIRISWALDAYEGAKQIHNIPELPLALRDVSLLPARPAEPSVETMLNDDLLMRKWKPAFSEVQLEKLRWLHAIWQTRYAVDAEQTQLGLTWAEQELQPALDLDFKQFPCYELASVQIDAWEAFILGVKHRREPTLLKVPAQYPPQFYDRRDAFSPVQSLILSLRVQSIAREGEAKQVELEEWTRLSAERVGIRRAAEIALYEADLLALRMPERATFLYQQANKLFQKCGDKVGGFFALTSEAMMSPHRRAAAIEKSTTECYVDMRAAIDDGDKLPLEDGLLSHISRAVRLELTDWAPRAWQPRLVRYLLLIVARVNYDGRGPAGRKVIRDLLPGAVLETSGTDIRVGADLANWMERAYDPPGFFRRAWKVIRDVGKVLVGFAFIIFLVALLFRAFSWLFSFVVPNFQERSTSIQVVTFVMVIAALSLSIRLLVKVRQRPKVSGESTAVQEETPQPEYPTWRIWVDFVAIWILLAVTLWVHFFSAINAISPSRIVLLAFAIVGGSLLFVFRGRLTRLGRWINERGLELFSLMLTSVVRLELVVRAQKDSSAGSRILTEVSHVQVILRVRTPGLEFWGRFGERFRTEHRFEIGPISGMQPYADLRAALADTQFPREIESLRERLRKFSLRIDMEMGEGNVNGLSWESLTQSTRGTDRERIYEYMPFDSYRSLEVRRRHVTSREGKARVLAITEGDLGESVARDGWRFLEGMNSRFDFEIKGLDEIFGRDPRPEVAMVHLIGSLESSYLGVGLRLGGETFQLSSRSSETQSNLDSLARAEDVLGAFPNLSACIIQEEPRQLSTERLDGDRRDAFFARLFASQMFAAGVPFVLVVPPLPAPEAAEAIQKIGEVLCRRSWSKRVRLLEAVQNLRLAIGRYALSMDADEVTTAELPQDLCLYFNRDWNGRLT